jgi:hypothetical protein
VVLSQTVRLFSQIILVVRLTLLVLVMRVTGGTANDSYKTYTFTNNTGTFNVNALNDIRVTGGTYSNGTAIFSNNTGGTFNVTGFKESDTV